MKKLFKKILVFTCIFSIIFQNFSAIVVADEVTNDEVEITAENLYTSIYESMLEDKLWVEHTLVDENYSTNPNAVVNGYQDKFMLYEYALKNYKSNIAYKELVDIWIALADLDENVTDTALSSIKALFPGNNFVSDSTNPTVVRFDGILKGALDGEYTTSYGSSSTGEDKIESYLSFLKNSEIGTEKLQEALNVSEEELENFTQEEKDEIEEIVKYISDYTLTVNDAIDSITGENKVANSIWKKTHSLLKKSELNIVSSTVAQWLFTENVDAMASDINKVMSYYGKTLTFDEKFLSNYSFAQTIATTNTELVTLLNRIKEYNQDNVQGIIPTVADTLIEGYKEVYTEDITSISEDLKNALENGTFEDYYNLLLSSAETMTINDEIIEYAKFIHDNFISSNALQLEFYDIAITNFINKVDLYKSEDNLKYVEVLYTTLNDTFSINEKIAETVTDTIKTEFLELFSGDKLLKSSMKDLFKSAGSVSSIVTKTADFAYNLTKSAEYTYQLLQLETMQEILKGAYLEDKAEFLCTTDPVIKEQKAKLLLDELTMLKKLKLYGTELAYKSTAQQLTSLVGITYEAAMFGDAGVSLEAYEEIYQNHINILVETTPYSVVATQVTVNSGEELMIMSKDNMLVGYFTKSDGTIYTIANIDKVARGGIKVNGGKLKVITDIELPFVSYVLGEIIVADGVNFFAEDIEFNSNFAFNGNISAGNVYIESDKYLMLGDYTLNVRDNLDLTESKIYVENENSKLVVGGDLNATYESIGTNAGTVEVKGNLTNVHLQGDNKLILSGTETQELNGVYFANCEVTNTNGIKLNSNVEVKGTFDTHNNPVDVNGYYFTLVDKAKLVSGNDYKSVHFNGGYIFREDVSCKGDFVFDSSSNSSWKINSGVTVETEGNVSVVQSSDTKTQILKIEGALRVLGDFNANYTKTQMIVENASLYIEGNYVEGECSNTFSEGRLEIKGNITNLTTSENNVLVLSGDKKQTISDSTRFSTIVIENESEEGVEFIENINVTTLFNHNRNNFSVTENSTFVDYDGDSLKDNIDPYPLIAGLKGDMNNDGKINSIDAALVLDKYKSDVTEEDLAIGDMNGDEKLNSIDAAMIIDIYKGIN